MEDKNKTGVMVPNSNIKFVANTNDKNKGSLSSTLLMPMSVVFLSICLSASMIISSVILSRSVNDVNKNLKEVGINVASSSTSSGTTTTTAAPTATTVTIDQIKGLYGADYLKFGDSSRKVLFVEFSDPSCPYCHIAGGKDPELSKSAGASFQYDTDGGSYVPPVREMKKLVDSGQASFLWIYDNGHGSGEMGTLAQYCANEKGKFWEVHDLLMSNAGYNLLNNTVKNDRAQSGTLADYLNSAVDKATMKSCLDSGKYNDRIASDVTIAKKFGVTGTPGFFVNAISYAGAYSYTDMKATVETALKS